MAGRDNGKSGIDDDALSPFALFCAYHLGLTPDGRRGPLNIHSVAAALAVSVADVEEALVRHGLEAERMLDTDFDLASAQLDVQVSPPGVDLRSIALMHWEVWLAAKPRTSDWRKDDPPT